MREIAVCLHISERHAYRLAERGELPGAFALGKSVRVNKGAFLAWQARLAATAEARVGSPGPTSA